jgi:hypothetical protein
MRLRRATCGVWMDRAQLGDEPLGAIMFNCKFLAGCKCDVLSYSDVLQKGRLWLVNVAPLLKIFQSGNPQVNLFGLRRHWQFSEKFVYGCRRVVPIAATL